MIKLLFLLLLVSCTTSTYINYDEYVHADQVNYIRNPIFTKRLHTTLPGEHHEYVQIGTFLPQNINSFENRTALHSIYALNMCLTNFDQIAFLEVISHERIPLVVISHRDILFPFETIHLENFAKSLGIFNTQVFVKLFPYARSHNYNPSEYVEFFQLARNIFREYAPNSIFVWNISENDVLDSHEFFPGLDYVDWVGITQKAYLTEQRTHREGLKERFSFFYHNYFSLPIMVTFGVSHFSVFNHSYHVDEAANFLKDYYSFLLNFPRVRAIIYSESNANYLNDNFSIMQSEIVLTAYNEIISDERIANEIFHDLGGKEVSVKVRTPYYEISQKN
ncbi:MAG: hypothetical protein FWE02_00210 [Defluviitaleaceae bacterium]|nr:hypothetical protein [Defluviitaleaceae bacterium]